MPAIDLALVVHDGIILALVLSLYILALLYANPRLFLRQYPANIRSAVPANTVGERFAAAALGFGLFAILGGGIYLSELHALATHEPPSLLGLAAHGFLVGAVFNLTDWLVLDELLLGRVRPRWARMPGAETLDYPFEHGRHFRGFLIGLIPCAVFAGIAAWILA